MHHRLTSILLGLLLSAQLLRSFALVREEYKLAREIIISISISIIMTTLAFWAAPKCGASFLTTTTTATASTRRSQAARRHLTTTVRNMVGTTKPAKSPVLLPHSPLGRTTPFTLTTPTTTLNGGRRWYTNHNTTTTATPGLSSLDVLKPEWTTPKQEGDHVPNVLFLCRVRVPNSAEENPFEWDYFTSRGLFAGKRCVVFALPGAFTPTCSTSHVPNFEAAFDEILELGVDQVYCVSVNDAFVMRQWGLHLGLTEDPTTGQFQKVQLLPDGAALFTRGMGMSTVWDYERGFGERSWRYSMVVNDCVIEKLFVEPGRAHNSGPDLLTVSDAEPMLDYLRDCDSDDE
ncbi:hypothetical protein ACA910_003288 [Epithemia clementina (nom. ined.)]